MNDGKFPSTETDMRTMIRPLSLTRTLWVAALLAALCMGAALILPTGARAADVEATGIAAVINGNVAS